jgi:hypothetical protein
MSTSQYTIRGIPNSVLKKVEIESKRTKRSKNELLLRAITDTYNVSVTGQKKWYDEFIGAMDEQTAKDIEEATKEQRTLHPKDYL